MESKKSIKPMEHYNMSDFLKGQASKIITKVSEEDTTGYTTGGCLRRMRETGGNSRTGQILS